jgi:hypothetical protein
LSQIHSNDGNFLDMTLAEAVLLRDAITELLPRV